MQIKFVLIGAAIGLAAAFLLRKTSVSVAPGTADRVRSM